MSDRDALLLKMIDVESLVKEAIHQIKLNNDTTIKAANYNSRMFRRSISHLVVAMFYCLITVVFSIFAAVGLIHLTIYLITIVVIGLLSTITAVYLIQNGKHDEHEKH